MACALCLMPDNFTLQGESTGAQWVNTGITLYFLYLFKFESSPLLCASISWLTISDTVNIISSAREATDTKQVNIYNRLLKL